MEQDLNPDLLESEASHLSIRPCCLSFTERETEAQQDGVILES